MIRSFRVEGGPVAKAPRKRSGYNLILYDPELVEGLRVWAKEEDRSIAKLCKRLLRQAVEGRRKEK